MKQFFLPEIVSRPVWILLQVENNECGLPCFGTQVESKAVEAKPECLKLKQAGQGVPHGFLGWSWMDRILVVNMGQHMLVQDE
jgi:hypothetical protein